ncbi:11383_t:CDS:2 [Paraglomus brasilianum]|uniref:11383_t:CDS:1 n=1 Tax=Paraglomus brasilianum TaxID=144538 RepID=A0A9N9FLK8_9GLOM|nr:11383_t:CDS:2 [Paraglomus brasilianum]
MSKSLRKVLFWAILIALILGAILFINRQIGNNEKKSEKSENKSNQKVPQPPNDKPKDNPKSPTDTENCPAITRYIQEGGEISEELKKAKIIFFPVNNSESHETADTGSHWTLLRLEVDKKYLPPKIYNDHECPQQTKGADCGVYVIAYTRFLVNEWKKKKGPGKSSFKEQDLIFTIAEERQKLKAVGFPKKGTPGKDYEIGDDVAYTEEEENRILE